MNENVGKRVRPDEVQRTKKLGDADILVAGEAGILRTGLEANSVASRERRSDYSYSWLATYLEIKLTS